MSAAGAASTALVLQNHAAAVDQFFGSVRIPASFIAGASFGGLFGLKAPDSLDEYEPIENFFRISYNLAIAISFLLSVNTVMTATVAMTRNLAGGYDPVAPSGYQLLNREFRFEFVVTRWSFFVSLFTFLFGVTNRMLFEFKLFATKNPQLRARRREVGVGLCLLTSSLILHLLSVVNSTLYCWNNLFEMTIDLVKMLATRGSWKQPLAPISLAMAVAGVGVIAHVLVIER